jgi:hypothetical protein
MEGINQPDCILENLPLNLLQKTAHEIQGIAMSWK